MKKNKIAPLLLATALMIGPISQAKIANASEESPKKEEVVQTIDQGIGDDFKVEYDNGDVKLEKNKNDKEKDVKDVGESEVKLKDANGNDVKVEEKDKKDKKDEDKKGEDLKVEETKDVSKPVYNEMKIVDKKDNDQNVNFITVLSKKSDNTPLTGFKYKLINNDTKKELELDFSSKTELIAKVPDGSYTIKFVSGPEKYSKEDDIQIKMPMKDKDSKDDYTRQTKVLLKHNMVKEKPTQNPKTMDDNNIAVPILLSVALIAVISYLVYLKKKNKSEKDGKKDVK